MISMVFSSYPMKEKIYVVPFTLPLVASLTCFSHKHCVAEKGDFFKVRNRDGMSIYRENWDVIEKEKERKPSKGRRRIGHPGNIIGDSPGFSPTT